MPIRVKLYAAFLLVAASASANPFLTSTTSGGSDVATGCRGGQCVGCGDRHETFSVAAEVSASTDEDEKPPLPPTSHIMKIPRSERAATPETSTTAETLPSRRHGDDIMLETHRRLRVRRAEGDGDAVTDAANRTFVASAMKTDADKRVNTSEPKTTTDDIVELKRTTLEILPLAEKLKMAISNATSDSENTSTVAGTKKPATIDDSGSKALTGGSTKVTNAEMLPKADKLTATSNATVGSMNATESSVQPTAETPTDEMLRAAEKLNKPMQDWDKYNATGSTQGTATEATTRKHKSFMHNIDETTAKESSTTKTAGWGAEAKQQAESWQGQRRYGSEEEMKNLPDFGNLDIRTLGGNQLDIDPVDVSNFDSNEPHRNTVVENLNEENTGEMSPTDNSAALLPSIVVVISATALHF